MKTKSWRWPKANLKAAHKLFTDGTVALAQIERNGIKVDVRYLNNAIKEVEKEIAEKKKELENNEVYHTWRKAYGRQMKLGNRAQLADIFFNKMGYKSERTTEGGSRLAADEEAFEKVDHPFKKMYFDIAHLEKALGTFLMGIRRELTSDGYVHCHFNLNTVGSFRSSATNFNIQQQPKRNRRMAEIVRKCFIPRGKKRRFGEGDLGQIEVRVAALYSLDPALMDYVTDPTKDMHRDQAMRCYLLEKEYAAIKPIRHAGKNMFVFPEFYGDYWGNCAQAMWDEIELSDLHYINKKGKKIGLRKHLARKGITSLGDPRDPQPGTFMQHMKEEEEYFWGKRFPVYAAWKKWWYQKYLEKGWLAMFTGFICKGLLSFNQAVNYPIQGSSFHYLLWCLIEMQKWLTKNKMQTLLLGEIHDSMMFDAVEDELQDVLGKLYELMTETLPSVWDWISVPITAEMEAAPQGGSWLEIEQWVPNKKGVWVPKKSLAA